MKEVAKRPGPIVSVQSLAAGGLADVGYEDEDYPLERLLTDRSVSVNTAAAGGNANLMTISQSIYPGTVIEVTVRFSTNFAMPSAANSRPDVIRFRTTAVHRFETLAIRRAEWPGWVRLRPFGQTSRSLAVLFKQANERYF